STAIVQRRGPSRRDRDPRSTSPRLWLSCEPMAGDMDTRERGLGPGALLIAGLLGGIGCGGDGGRADDGVAPTTFPITITATDGDPTETSMSSVDATLDGTHGGQACEVDG